MCWVPKIGFSGTQNLNEKFAKRSSKIKSFMFDEIFQWNAFWFYNYLKNVSKNLPIFGKKPKPKCRVIQPKPNLSLKGPWNFRLEFLRLIFTRLYIYLSLYLQDAQEYGKSEKLRCQDLFYCPKSLLELREQYLNL